MRAPDKHSDVPVRGSAFRWVRFETTRRLIDIMVRTFAAALALLLGATFISSQSAVARTVDIGVAAAVRPQATGTPPEQEARILHVGIDLFANERIETGKAGQTHLLFRDGSALSVGPNASLKLDEFVYSPETKSGTLALSVTKGVFRFVGGRLSKNQPVLFKTPTAVIGIRGGVAMMNVNAPQDVANAQAQGQTLNPAEVTMLYGDEVFMDNGQTRQTMTRPGSIMTQTPDGGFTPPAPASQQQLNTALTMLEEPQDEPEDDDGAGGLGSIAPAAGGPTVSDADVADSQISNLGSNNSPTALEGGAPPAPPATEAAPTTDDAAQQIALDDQSTQLPTSPPEPALPIQPPVVTPPIEAVIDADTLANLVAEGAPLGTLIAILAQLVSEDSGATATFSLPDNAQGRFAIDPATGRVSVANGEIIDFETATEHSITIQAQSSSGNSISLTVGIQVEDDTSEFTVVSVTDVDSALNQVSETASNGSVVGLMGFADDADGSDSVSYSLVNDADGRFTIDSGDGTITVADASQIDFESNTSHSVTVRATSTDGSFADQTFTIAVLDDPGDNPALALIGRARCCEINGTGTTDGNGARDYVFSNVNLVGNGAVFNGPNGVFTMFYPSSDGTFGAGASTGQPFDAGFGIVTAGTVTSAHNRDFVFYEVNNASGLRGIFLTGPQTPQSVIPTSGYSIFKIFDDVTVADSPNVTRVPFVRNIVSGQEDAADAFFAWSDNAGTGQDVFGIGRILISGTGTAQDAGVSVVTGNIETSGDDNTYLDGWQRGSQRRSNGNPRHFDGRVASLPLLSKTDTAGHFIGSSQPVGFHLAAATANGGLEPSFTGITRRHGADDFTDRPNAVGVLESHSANTANSRTNGIINGYAGGVFGVYTDGSTSTAPDEFEGFVAVRFPDASPNFFVHRDAANNQIDVQLPATSFHQGDNDADFVINFGGFGGNGTSVLIDDKIFMAREDDSSASSTGSVDGVPLVTSQVRAYFTTAHNFEHNGFQGTTTFCTCSYLTWGFLGFDAIDPNTNDLARSQLATWVAGTANTTRGNFPDGTATYSGHVFGTVGLPANGTLYAAVGDLDMNLRFFNSGHVEVTSGSISNFDGGTYSMTDVGAEPDFTFHANLSLTAKAGYAAGDITGRFVGSFYGNGSPPENIAGNFRLEKLAGAGPDYDAAGIGMAEIVTP